MRTQTAELAAILENEISIGKDLLGNVEAQKKAILHWDIDNLLAQIKARELHLRSLTELETRRAKVVKSTNSRGVAVTLRQIIATLPKESSERAQLAQLRDNASKLFNRVHSEETAMHEFMKTLLAHIQESFKMLSPALVPIYGESGAALSQRPEPGLLHSKV